MDSPEFASIPESSKTPAELIVDFVEKHAVKDSTEIKDVYGYNREGKIAVGHMPLLPVDEVELQKIFMFGVEGEAPPLDTDYFEYSIIYKFRGEKIASLVIIKEVMGSVLELNVTLGDEVLIAPPGVAEDFSKLAIDALQNTVGKHD